MKQQFQHERKRSSISCQRGSNANLAAARQSFKEHEALVYQQLAQLIRDGVWLKSYIAAVMRVEQASHTCSLLHYPLVLLPGAQPHPWPPWHGCLSCGSSEGVMLQQASGIKRRADGLNAAARHTGGFHDGVQLHGAVTRQRGRQHE
jgi:hypothetical protein